MSEVRFIDTTLRDGQLSLWALGMRIGHMLAAAERMDRCRFESIPSCVLRLMMERVVAHGVTLTRSSNWRQWVCCTVVLTKPDGADRVLHCAS